MRRGPVSPPTSRSMAGYHVRTVVRLAFDIRTDAPPEAVRAALLDFTEHRPEVWPGLPADQYQVYDVGDTWAEIREGYRGRIWVRERYDWSEPDTVRFTLVDSGFAMPGGEVVVFIRPDDAGGSMLHITWDRTGKGLFGKLFVGLVALTRGAPVRRSFDMGLARIADSNS
jgi:hypothetical protein